MPTPSLMILTEPANCEGVDAQLLLQAVLQTQHLSKEGVPVSQAFCDNPAAADEFIDTYAKAYPELLPHSPDLPPPEQLYSMLIDGRLAPLPGLNTAPDGTKLEDAAVLHQLLVLSLGKPDALMQALQGQQSMRNSVKVIEIAPEPDAESAPVSVAAAVAVHTTGAPPWSAGAPSSQSRHDQDDALSASEEGTDSSLKLESVEFNLDHIERNSIHEQVHPAVPVAGIVDATPLGSADNAGPAPLAHADASTTGAAGDTSLVSQTDPHGSTAMPAPEPIATPPAEPTAPPAPAQTAVSEGRDSVVDDTTPDTGQDANTSADLTDGSTRDIADPDAAETGDAAPGDTSPDVGQGADVTGDSEHGSASASAPDTRDAASNDRPSDAGQASDQPSAADPEDADLADEQSSFHEPGGDIIYPPPGGFMSEDDTSYPLPAVAASEADSFGDVLRMSMADDIVDLETLTSSDAFHPPAAVEPFDPILMRPPGSDGQEMRGFCSPDPAIADLSHLAVPGPDEDIHHDKSAASGHDLDI